MNSSFRKSQMSPKATPPIGNLKYSVALFFIFISLLGCQAKKSTLPQTANYIVERSLESALDIIYKNGKKCWSKEDEVFGGFGIKIEKFAWDERFVGVFARYWGRQNYGTMPAFFSLTITRKKGKNHLKIEESGELNFTADANRWLKGDVSCSTKNNLKN